MAVEKSMGNPDLQKSDLLATIRYEIVKVDGIPAVSINEYAQ